MVESVSPFTALRRIGQSIWLDNLSRDMIAGGELARLVAAGEATGITTNPAIFRKAITSGNAYARSLAELKRAESDPERRYERMAVADVQAACDVLKPVHDSTSGDDGYVSLEVSPRLAYDVSGTVAAARRLHAEVSRDNVLIKIPGTPEGAVAFEQCIAEGISVNVTLLFSLSQMERIFDAYLSGLEKLRASGGDVSRVKSVASFFMSRIDTLVDRRLDEIGSADAAALKGRMAVAVGKLAYVRYGEIFGGPRFGALKASGARAQYLLWASTSTKNPAYDDLLYVEPLVGPETVNTLPDATLVALRDHGKPRLRIGEGIDEARDTLDRLQRLGIDPDAVGLQLQREGVKLFEDAYDGLLEAVS
ncbi:MAG: transaldolase [Betaproteobacteria bacterium]|nr:transaldolase [Betaproteobacteria bacterium]